jgi:hypothetical protein
MHGSDKLQKGTDTYFSPIKTIINIIIVKMDIILGKNDKGLGLII